MGGHTENTERCEVTRIVAALPAYIMLLTPSLSPLQNQIFVGGLSPGTTDGAFARACTPPRVSLGPIRNLAAAFAAVTVISVLTFAWLVCPPRCRDLSRILWAVRPHGRLGASP